VLAVAAAALGFIDLLTGVAGGIGSIGLPVLGAILGWVSLQRGAPRNASLTAIGLNAAALVLVAVAIFAFGGS